MPPIENWYKRGVVIMDVRVLIDATAAILLPRGS
jgi:hypothetical protein